MRKVNHIILNFEIQKKITSNYWALNFLDNQSNSAKLLTEVDLYKKFELNKQLKKKLPFLKEEKKYTVKLNTSHPTTFMKEWEKEGIVHVFEPVKETKDKSTKDFYLKYSQSKGRDSYMYLKLSNNRYYQRNIKRLLLNWESSNRGNSPHQKFNSLNNLVNINFLRKERLYTKLKYSRSPAYDIVSGGSAALLSGFIGFLVSEKFGFELVDSGDFYYGFMYLVFIAFSLRPLVFASDSSTGFIEALSLRKVLNFYLDLVNLFIKLFKKVN